MSRRVIVQPFIGILRSVDVVSICERVQSARGAYTSPARSSKVSPFFGGAKAFLIRLTAISLA